MRDLSSELNFGVSLALQAGRTMRAGLGSVALLKGDGTPVTRIDQAINDAVAERRELMLGEEDVTHSGPTSGRVWVCDPIDGTWLFAAGVPGAVFSLALVEDGRALLGVVYDPWTDRLIHASTGTGAFLNGRPIKVNGAAGISGSCLALPGGQVDQLSADRLFADAIDVGADVVTTGSAIADALMVPLGLAAGTVYPYTSPWDMAAIAAIVTEAGGRITDLHGRDQRYDTRVSGAVVSNGRVHGGPARHGGRICAKRPSHRRIRQDDHLGCRAGGAVELTEHLRRISDRNPRFARIVALRDSFADPANRAERPQILNEIAGLWDQIADEVGASAVTRRLLTPWSPPVLRAAAITLRAEAARWATTVGAWQALADPLADSQGGTSG